MAQGEKFQFVEPNPQPCSEEELREHVAAFVDCLITSARRDRWRLNLVDKPQRAAQEMTGSLPLDDRFSRELTRKEAWPQHIEALTGSNPGVYFDFSSGNGVKLRPAEAASVAAQNFADAILSIAPGRLAVFFNHDSQAWLCQR